MATITISIPEDSIVTAINGIALVYGYAPGPETKADFATRTLVKLIRDAYRVYQLQQDIAPVTSNTNIIVDAIPIAAQIVSAKLP